MSEVSAGRSLVLASGGIETAVLLHLEASEGRDVRAAFLGYGQRPAGMEYRGALAQCQATGARLEALDMASLGDTFQGEDERRYHIPLPHRNLVALSLGLSLAEKRQADRLVVGLTADDGAVSPSSTATFLANFRTLADGLGEVAVTAPLLTKSKSEVIRQGFELDVDFSRTYSCLLGYAQPCGHCPQCRKRAAAFAAAGLTDPPCQLADGDP